MTTNYDVYLGVDACQNHPPRLRTQPRRQETRATKNYLKCETKLIALLTKLSKHGQILVAVDRPASLHAH